MVIRARYICLVNVQKDKKVIIIIKIIMDI